MNRREFIKGTFAAAVGAFSSGCVSRRAGRVPFYGLTIRDRLWMWGHHVDCAKIAANCADDRSKKDGFVFPGRAVDQAEGCRLMGIPNNCVIRWGNLPRYPWGDYFDQFKGLKRISFGIEDGAAESTDEKMRIAFEELLPKMPNLTGCFLDDFFLCARKSGVVPDLGRLAKISDAVHAHGLRLSVVAYSDQVGLRREFKPHFDLCDEVSFWFWRGGSIPTMRDSVRRCRDFLGADKDLLLGLYMWDFAAAASLPAELMTRQLDCARQFLADRTVSGLIFHPTFAAALDVPAVKLSKAWIREHGDTAWGDMI